MRPLYVESIGVVATGLNGWIEATKILRGEQALGDAIPPPHQPQLLPPNERRRASAAVRLAFRVAEEAAAASTRPVAQMASVFASSDADTAILGRICGALAQSPRVVSPTDFHNSVHNAAPGYWSIAATSRAPSVSLSAWDASFVAGLLEAWALLHDEGRDLLLVAYDLRAPEPLHAVRAIECDSAVAMVLCAEPAASRIARIEWVGPAADTAVSRMEDGRLERLRCGAPPLRALPLLASIARRQTATVVLQGAAGLHHGVSVSPC